MKQYVCDTCGSTCEPDCYQITITFKMNTEDKVRVIERSEVFDCCSLECAQKQITDTIKKYSNERTFIRATIGSNDRSSITFDF